MKSLLKIILTILILNVDLLSADIFRIDSVKQFSTLRNDSKTIYSYNENGFLLTQEKFEDENEERYPLSVKDYEYDLNNKISKEIISIYQQPDWMLFSIVENTYDQSGNLTERLIGTRSGDSWSYYRKIEYKHDESGNVTTETTRSFDNGNWKNKTLIYYEYDLSNNLLSETEQTWQDKWMNRTKNIYDYDPAQRLIFELVEIWQENRWINSSIKTYNYNQLNLVTSSYYGSWSEEDEDWMNVWQWLYEYDLNGNNVEVLNQTWNILIIY